MCGSMPLVDREVTRMAWRVTEYRVPAWAIESFAEQRLVVFGPGPRGMTWSDGTKTSTIGTFYDQETDELCFRVVRRQWTEGVGRHYVNGGFDPMWITGRAS